MKPGKTLFCTSLLLILLGSQSAFAVDSESLGDELKKLKKTATAEQPVTPAPTSGDNSGNSSGGNTTLASNDK